ncbi:MAG: [FeFe] hydrogenase H-cluster radical SAM maturase HydE [Deltaproteobacteria bacterium]|nr:[FeFe] hydrogenase H-cluster radical SAM maturase HydE [Deltaproteobacteria bacterium]
MTATLDCASLDAAGLSDWLREDDPERLHQLWARADQLRRDHVGDAVHLRGLVEISNRCVRACWYCGIRKDNHHIQRYRMTATEVVEAAALAKRLGYGTVVLQAGEDPGLSQPWVADVVQRIAGETGLAVTLSLGERKPRELQAWRQAGADRYLLRFETSDPALFAKIHPALGHSDRDRFAILAELHDLGYEVGSGFLIGIPGQSYASLAQDLLRCRDLDLDMIGVGPWLTHPDTPLGQGLVAPLAADDQVPASEAMTLKCVALLRILCPDSNLPATTALATLNGHQGREHALQAGANVVMPNVTPLQYRALYEIYPGKACVSEHAEVCAECLAGRIAKVGRTVGRGPGGRARRPPPA